MNNKRLIRPPFHWVFLGIFASLAWLLGDDTGQTRSGNERPAQAVVAEVIDGDTIELVSGERVRYLGINAPEVRVKRGSRWAAQPQPYGKEATAFNRKLVQGKEVQLEYDTEIEDDYGRLLAYVRIDSVLVNEELVKEGLALVDVRMPNVKYQKDLLRSQKKAKTQEIGIWAAAARHRIAADDAHRHLDEFALVHGTIRRVHSGKGKWYLHFDGDSHNDFTAVIYRDYLHLMIPDGADPRDVFQNKKAQVYGFIRRSPGPVVVISAPTQIDVLEEP